MLMVDQCHTPDDDREGTSSDDRPERLKWNIRNESSEKVGGSLSGRLVQDMVELGLNGQYCRQLGSPKAFHRRMQAPQGDDPCRRSIADLTRKGAVR